jgi:hypothetical protein
MRVRSLQMRPETIFFAFWIVIVAALIVAETLVAC